MCFLKHFSLMVVFFWYDQNREMQKDYNFNITCPKLADYSCVLCFKIYRRQENQLEKPFSVPDVEHRCKFIFSSVWQEWEIQGNTFVAMLMREGDSCGAVTRTVRVSVIWLYS